MEQGIFILEDDETTAAAVRGVAQREGWRFDRAARVQGALEAIRSFRPDLVVLDVNLPDGDGFAVCRALKADPALAAVPALFLTADAEVGTRLAAFEAGAQDYMPKPFSLDELAARLRVHLGQKKALDYFIDEKKRLLLRERTSKELADDIVHDLRTPVTCIKATLELLADGTPLAGGLRERLLADARDSAEFLIFLVNDLLDLQTGRLDVSLMNADLERLAARLHALFSGKFPARGATLKISVPPGGPRPLTDPALLLRVAVNLIGNALRYTPAGGEVAVLFTLPGKGLRLEVLDQGPGVPEEKRETIFRKFSAEGAAGLDHGKGIGLSFCRKACTALGGTIRVEARDGGGSRFIAELPADSKPGQFRA